MVPRHFSIQIRKGASQPSFSDPCNPNFYKAVSVGHAGTGRALRGPTGGVRLNEIGDIELRVQPDLETDYQTQFQQAMADAHAALENQYRVRIEKGIEESRKQLSVEIGEKVRKEHEAELRKRIAHLEEVRGEIARVLGLLENSTAEIKRMVEDPAIQLSLIMRKKTEQSELGAYLAGLRYSIGDTK